MKEKINHSNWYTKYLSKSELGTSLVIQWLRLHLLMQGVRIPSLVKELRYHMLLLLLLLSRFSRVRLCDPRDGSPPGSGIPGILQARTLDWVAISFSSAWKWKVKVKSLSRVRLLATPWTAAYQAPPSLGFCRQEYWSGVPLPSLKIPHALWPKFQNCKTEAIL